jgi:hypothetical protein
MMQASLQLVKTELERLLLQQKLLQANEDAQLQAGTDIKRLDASVKKNTALIKKLRNITEDNAVSLLDDIARTNQAKVHHMQDMPFIALLFMWLPGPPEIATRLSRCLCYQICGNVMHPLHAAWQLDAHQELICVCNAIVLIVLGLFSICHAKLQVSDVSQGCVFCSCSM